MELKSGRSPTEQEFYYALASAPGVERVDWTSTKTSQNLLGIHYMERNINVWVPGYASNPLEFQLTRHQHMKDAPDVPFTVTACFKQPPLRLHGHAWRILLHAVQGRELLAAHARGYANRALAKSGATLTGEN